MSNVNELTTYAQNREDLYIFALLHKVKKGFYVDVGANHEELHSVTKMFYNRGWRGINIEPNAKLIEELTNNRKRDINLQVGLSNKNGQMIFREYPDYDGLSTLSSEIKEANAKSQYAHIDYKIPVKKLADVLESNNVKSIDFLKIDVEGHELAVLEGNDWEKYRPKLVIIEGTDSGRTLPYLNKVGYRVEFFDGLNFYLVEESNSDITIHNFAGTVLSKGIKTRVENELETINITIQDKVTNLEREVERLHEAILNGIGVKRSIISLVKSLIRKLRISGRTDSLVSEE